MHDVQPLHTADMLGSPLRFFRSPLAGEDLPWHSPEDLWRACALPRAVRRDYMARLRSTWKHDVRTVQTADDAHLIVGPHWMAQGITQAIGGDEGPLFFAYCRAAKDANDKMLLLLGLTPIEGVSRTMRAVMRGESGHVH